MSARCEIDGFPIEVAIGEYGRTVSRCPGCERRRAGRCMDCGAPVRGRSWRCEAHRAERGKWHMRMAERRHRKERRAAERKRYRRMTPEQREARAAHKKAWRGRNVVRIKLSKRKGRLDGTWGYSSREKYLAAQQAQNDRRAESKRVRMRELYRQRSPSWGKPRECRDCGASFDWSHRGRPPVRCPGCRQQEAA